MVRKPPSKTTLKLGQGGHLNGLKSSGLKISDFVVKKKN
jgi:hypothetical protein